MTLTYDDLTPMQRARICNGCGRKGGPVKPPDFAFGEACDRHDFAYWRGGNRKDRLEADRAFLRDMRRRALTPAGIVLAIVYYQAVRLFGRKCFHWGVQRNMWDVVEMGVGV